MFYNYFKTAFRNLLRNKRYAAINIVGLTVGIAACLLIFLVIQFETSLFLISSPVAYYLMHKWLQNYTYRIDISASIFLLAIAGSIIIAWIAVGHRAIKAAIANPVKSLRTE